MKKSFGLYFIGWLAALCLFNLVAFITPNNVGDETKFDTLFFVSYSLITVFFISQLVCTYFVFKNKALTKTFYSIPMLSLSIYALVAILLVGGLCTSIAAIPDLIGIIACFAVAVINLLAMIKTSLTAGAVSRVDEKIKEQTAFIKLLTADAESLLTKTTDSDAKKLTNKVYEAIRYSDPMSAPALEEIEGSISLQFAEFSDAVSKGELDVAENACRELLSLVGERNTKCKALK